MLSDLAVKTELHTLNEKGITADYISGLLVFGGEIVLDKKGAYLIYSSTDYECAMEFCTFLKTYGYAPEIEIKRPTDKRKKKSYSVTVKGDICRSVLQDTYKAKFDAGKIVALDVGVTSKFSSQKAVSEYSRAIYMGAGNISRAGAGYRIVISFDEESDADAFLKIVSNVGVDMNKQEKDGKFSVITRKGQALSDFLALVGASKSVLELQDTLVQKEAMGRILRASNAVAANADKAAGAAVKQMQDIAVIRTRIGRKLPEELEQAAALREKYPDAALPELVKLANFAISKSGLYHRFQKIAEIAEEIRKQN